MGIVQGEERIAFGSFTHQFLGAAEIGDSCRISWKGVLRTICKAPVLDVGQGGILPGTVADFSCRHGTSAGLSNRT